MTRTNLIPASLAPALATLPGLIADFDGATLRDALLIPILRSDAPIWIVDGLRALEDDTIAAWATLAVMHLRRLDLDGKITTGDLEDLFTAADAPDGVQWAVETLITTAIYPADRGIVIMRSRG